MSLGSQQPFIDSRAFDKADLTYVSFPSQADAMIASLQLSHYVPCPIMDLIFSVITHPDFDAKQVTLRSSIDVIDVAEESRLEDRLAVVHKRSLGKDGRMEQAGFPEFVLDEVLDIIHAERTARIGSSFNDASNTELVYRSDHIYEDEILKTMSLVHRSWTIPSQKALCRILFINRPTGEMIHYHSPAWESIFGPWTTVVAFDMHCDMNLQVQYDEYELDFQEEYRQWFRNMHRILVGFTNLRSVWIKSYNSFFTKWANRTIGELVRRNTYLKDVTLHSANNEEQFIVDSLAENSRNLKFLETLNIEGARFSDATPGKLMQGASFLYLSSLTIKCARSSLEMYLETLRIITTLSNPCLQSLHIIYRYNLGLQFEEITTRLFPPAQCAVSFGQLRSLHIDCDDTADKWLKWIGPYCSSLKDVTLDTKMLLSADTLSLIPATIQSLYLQGMNARWSTIERSSRWREYILGTFSSGHFSELKSFSLLVPEPRFEILEYEFGESRKQEVPNLRDQIREFKESMKCLCESAGIECSLDL